MVSQQWDARTFPAVVPCETKGINCSAVWAGPGQTGTREMFRNQIMICLCHIIVRSIGFTIWQNDLGDFSSWVVQKSKLKFRRIILAAQIYLYVDKVAAGSPIRLAPWQSGESQRCPELGYWRGNGGKWIYLKDTVFIKAAITESHRPHG